jgi:acetylornithine/N-succinyldiaminopimelate aminotransferase
MNIRELDDTYVAHTYARAPLTLVRGKGAEVWDDEGRRYIDLGTGIAVNTFGYCDDAWQEAVIRQVGKLQHASNLYYTEPAAALAALLCKRTGMRRVFFSNSGAEANECAIKAARRWATLRYGDGVRPGIITLKNSFHGRTLATLAATGQDVFHHDFGPFPEGFITVDPANPGELTEAARTHPVTAVMLELVQGEGGVLPLSDAFLDEVKSVTREHELLLIVDEVQTGNGRTGSLYAYQSRGLSPDIVSTAKGLAGGLPFGATMLGERVCDVLTPGTHGSTFGGNPIAAAAALSVIERIDDELLCGVREKEAYIRRELEGAPGVISVTGAGLMLGIESERPAAEVVADCRDAGVIVLTAKTKIRLLPPLNIPQELLVEAIGKLKSILAKKN